MLKINNSQGVKQSNIQQTTNHLIAWPLFKGPSCAWSVMSDFYDFKKDILRWSFLSFCVKIRGINQQMVKYSNHICRKSPYLSFYVQYLLTITACCRLLLAYIILWQIYELLQILSFILSLFNMLLRDGIHKFSLEMLNNFVTIWILWYLDLIYLTTSLFSASYFDVFYCYL